MLHCFQLWSILFRIHLWCTACMEIFRLHIWRPQVLYCSHSCRDMHGLSVHGLPIVDMTGSYYLAGFWEIIQCSLQVIQYGFVSFRNSSSFCCISGFENFCRQYDTRIAGLCITRKFSETSGPSQSGKVPAKHTIRLPEHQLQLLPDRIS
ncbi:Uncharacterised protein [Bacteroides thetaiotaomicron]|nr:Uncharacterised protein [Bacteroides thetaiotaomicron]